MKLMGCNLNQTRDERTVHANGVYAIKWNQMKIQSIQIAKFVQQFLKAPGLFYLVSLPHVCWTSTPGNIPVDN